SPASAVSSSGNLTLLPADGWTVLHVRSLDGRIDRYSALPDPLQTLPVKRSPLLIMFGVDDRNLFGLERADDPRRRTGDQRVFRELLAGRDHRAGTDDAAAPDQCAVQHDRAHADQRGVLDRATVQDGVVADGAVLSDRERKAGIGMAGAIVLDVGA